MTKTLSKHLLALLVFGLATSCVSEKKGSDPSCAAGTAFNKLTQTCVAYGKAPASTLNVLNLNEDDPATTFTLQYTDDNQDEAASCQVFDSETDFEVRSPVFADIPADVTDIVNVATQCATSINSLTYPSESATATSLLTLVQQARDGIYSTDTTTGMSAAINLLSSRITNLTNYCESFSPSPVVQFYGKSARNSNTELLKKKEWIDARCYCISGECSSEIILNDNISGSYGISYNISDAVDGTSITKQVLVNVASVNDAPIASDLYVSGNESVSTGTNSIAFTIPVGRDVENDYSPFFTYEIVSSPINGVITGCALSSDGSASTDRSCIYTPNDNDSGVTPLINKNSTLTLPSNLATNDLIFTSKAIGSLGDDISVTISQHPLLNTGSSIEVEVSNRDIIIYIDNEVSFINDVINAVNNDLKASSIVTVSSTNSINDNIGISAKQNLSGGINAFDNFTYKVNDGQNSSIYSGRGSIDIFSQDDPPVAVTTPALSLILTEDTQSIIRFTVTDSEGDTATACTVTPSSSNLVITSACTCPAGELYCDVGITPIPDYYGVSLLTWSIATTGTSGAQYSLNKYEAITVNATNDDPLAKNIALDIGAESSTATPSAYTFNLSSALGIDVDGDSLSYELLSSLGGATLTGCLSGTTLLAGSTCIYTPTDGNLNGVSTKAGFTYSAGGGSLTFEATHAGEFMNGVDVIIQDSLESDYLGTFIRIESNSLTDININIYIDSGTTTLQNIYDAINAHLYASQLVTIPSTSNTSSTASAAAFTLAGATAAAAKLEYKVTDGNGGEAYGAVHLNITTTDDVPVLCPYSDFSEAPECGLAGCIGDTSPVTRITPKSTGVLYYDKGSAVCYKSSGISSSSDWDILTDYSSIIEKKIVNQNGFLEIDNIMIDEGGADTDEDNDTITISNITIADGGLGLVPRKSANIQVFYDDDSRTISPAVPTSSDFMTGSLGDGTDSSDNHPVKIKIIPSDGVTGTAVVTITFSDGTNEINLPIPIEITDVAVQHKGWTNIIAMGPKVDKNGNVKDADYVCNYSETKCDSGESCSGVSIPTANVTADEINAIYYEEPSVSKPDGQCYYASAVGSSNWVAFDSFCNMTPSYYETACSNATCLDTAGTTVPTIEPTELNTFFTNLEYDAVNDIANTTCYRSIGRAIDGGSSLTPSQITNSWQEYKGTGSVELSWNTMLLTGTGTISGYNVFRRLSLESFDYKRPINKDLISAYTNKYIDNSSNSNVGPVPNTVYFYEVVPVVSTGTPAENVQIRSSDFEKIVLRVLVPGQNRVLVPRDIVNITQCDKLLDSSGSGSNYEYDSTLNTFTCPYEGPGDTGSVSGSTIYDFGRDLIVDRFEAGCPYTKSNESITACPTGLANVATSGSCIGTIDPTAADGGGPITFTGAEEAQQVYYNRSNGKCFQYDSGTWSEFDTLSALRLATLADRYHNAELPPVVHASQDTVNNFCAETSTEAILGICNEVGTFTIDIADTKRCINSSGGNYENYNNFSGRLPSRKEQVAYSDWDLTDISDSTASTREGGLSLNSNSKCNTSSANGLETYYTDSVTPISNTLYTLPGTLSSAIRSVMTGSSETELCSSKYGVQDSIGNVTEWSSERMYCNSFACVGLVDGDTDYIGNGDDDLQPADGATTAFDFYRFDGIIGPCISTGGVACDGYLSEWIYDQKSNGSSRFFTPMGLPAVTSYITTNPSEFVSNFFEQIGISNGITSTKLHDDTVVVNQELSDRTNNPTNTRGYGGFVTGGSYLSSNGAGTYHLEMIAVDDPAYNSRVDLGFRCVFPVSNNYYIE